MEIVKLHNFLESENPLVVGVFNNETVKINSEIDEEINTIINGDLFKKELGNVNKIYTFNKIKNKVVYLISLGKKDDYSYEKMQKAVKNISLNLGEKLIVLVDTFIGNLNSSEALRRMLLTVSYYDYKYDECKSKKDEKNLEIAFIGSNINELILDQYYKVSNAINNTRDLVNKPYNYLNAADLAKYAFELVKSLNNDKVKIKVLNKDEISALGMNAYLGVNKGSKDEPKLIHITYQGLDNFNDPIALIGKGIMFDTGGYSIKENMCNMKDDMGGAATVLGVLQACVENEVKVNLQVIICATDNRIDGGAYLPDDVLTAMNKKTIEIVSTDAEGRLTLADALCYAQKEGSKKLIDLATLTGSVVVALGDYTTGIFGNDQTMINDIIKYGNEESEHIWQLPITDYIREKVRGSKVADLTNSTGRYMGASSAAAFLEEFVEEGSKWVHLDIAGTVFRTSPAYGEFYGATGVLVKTLYQYLKSINN